MSLSKWLAKHGFFQGGDTAGDVEDRVVVKGHVGPSIFGFRRVRLEEKRKRG